MQGRGFGQPFALQIFGNFDGLPLVGIGNYFEALWNDLLALMNE